MTDKKVGNARLLKLAAFLRTVPRKRFDYNVWVGNDWQGAPDLSCGTTACALGWAATMPEFRRLGLMLRRFDGDKFAYVAHKDNPNSTDSFGAAQKIFGITGSEAIDLFSPSGQKGDDGDATPKQVAKKIEQFVGARA